MEWYGGNTAPMMLERAPLEVHSVQNDEIEEKYMQIMPTDRKQLYSHRALAEGI